MLGEHILICVFHGFPAPRYCIRQLLKSNHRVLISSEVMCMELEAASLRPSSACLKYLAFHLHLRLHALIIAYCCRM